MTLPRVAIVGRPNVGKSSLMNLLAGRKISIVDPTAGVTRDRVSTEVEFEGVTVELVDTGGYGISGYEGATDLTADIERQIATALAEADVVLFVIDAQAGVTPLDHEVAVMIRHSRLNPAKLLVVANKVDGPSYEAHAMEAHALGMGEPHTVSAMSKHGKHELIAAIVAALPEHIDRAPPPDAVTIAIVGKRNAGKSTLTNALAGSQRVIVNAEEGTTRDAVDVRFEVEGRAFLAVDTAGLRKRKAVKEDIEYYSHHRALRAIRRADVVLLLLDATVPVSQVDEKLAQETLKHFKPTIVVVNKWDLVEDQQTQGAYVDYLEQSMRGLGHAPIAFISADRGEGVRDLIAMAWNLYQQAGDRVATAELNRLFEGIVQQRPPPSKLGKRAKIYYVSQVETRPPTIVLQVNDPKLFDPGYQRYLLAHLREEVPYSEIPIQLIVRGKQRDAAAAAGV